MGAEDVRQEDSHRGNRDEGNDQQGPIPRGRLARRHIVGARRPRPRQDRRRSSRGGGASGLRRAHLPGHSLRAAAARRLALEAAAAVEEVGRSAAGREVRPALHAGTNLRRHELPLRPHERRLPLPKRLDACEVWQGKAAGAGLFLRRRLRRGLSRRAALRW